MSYTKDKTAYYSAMNGVPRHVSQQILRLANRLHLIELIRSNFDVDGKLVHEAEQLHAALQSCVGGSIEAIESGGDPRGGVVRLKLANRVSNSIAGGYVVPTRARYLTLERLAVLVPNNGSTNRASMNDTDTATCPHCGGEMPSTGSAGVALSRADNQTRICAACGAAEAIDSRGKRDTTRRPKRE